MGVAEGGGRGGAGGEEGRGRKELDACDEFCFASLFIIDAEAVKEKLILEPVLVGYMGEHAVVQQAVAQLDGLCGGRHHATCYQGLQRRRATKHACK